MICQNFYTRLPVSANRYKNLKSRIDSLKLELVELNKKKETLLDLLSASEQTVSNENNGPSNKKKLANPNSCNDGSQMTSSAQEKESEI